MIIRDWLAGIKILAHQNPRLLESAIKPEKYIPHPYKAVCLISADFEMAWAFCHSKSTSNTVDRAVRLGLDTQKNVPVILDLSDRYDVPITWATVGHLFLETCNKVNGVKHPDLPRIPYFTNDFWKYTTGDWFDNDPCTDMIKDPAWYAVNLIDNIISRKTEHEIGCHSFSHIDCSDIRCPEVVFNAEIEECLRLAEHKGLKLTSFVHPGHQIGHLERLRQYGFESYRTDFGNYLGGAALHKSGLWELKNTAEINYKDSWTAGFNRYRYTKIIDRAIKQNKVAVLWFHPSCNKQVIDKAIEPLFRYLDEHRDEIWITTHSNYTRFLNNNV